MDKQKVYFPNLNGLRFFAALLVILSHIEQIKASFNIDGYWGVLPVFVVIGKLGVALFFVLSGFLITYLLITEEHTFQTISIKKFLIRRILRIWPLYFLIIILALLVLPNISIFTIPGFGKEVVYMDLLLKLFLYAIFFPNLIYSLVGIVPYASHLWSIGTEEQFYLLWPAVLKYFKKHRIQVMLFIIFSYFILARLLTSHYTDFLPYKHYIQSFWLSFQIDSMAIGGIFAILLFQKHRILKFFLNNYLFYASIILVLILMLNGVYIRYIQYEFYSLFFGIIILNFAGNNRIKISLENKALNYLGKISYGIYMYQPICIVLALVIAMTLNYTTNWFIYPLSFLFTIVLAGLSYKYFEVFFLILKKRHTRIQT